MYYIYAIYNPQHKKIYIGQTADITERLKLHNEHVFKGYTSKFDGVWQLIYSEKVDTRQEALKREKQLKSYQGRLFIRKHIRE